MEATAAKAKPSFYQRKLPDSCIAFSSKLGKKIFASSLSNGGLKSFFPLIQQFTTQSEPAFCGLSTLVLVLNALSVDPRQNWKGPWRWYEESMLNCCLDLEEVKETGITLKDFHCLAHCQGLSVDLKYCTEENSSLEDFRGAVKRACVERSSNDDDDDSDEELDVLVVSYSRKTMGQTGSGHFSPLAAYDAESDSVLILDTARFKYGAHWAKLSLVYEAMKPIDLDTGKSRGYALLSFPPHQRKTSDDEESLQPMSIFFRSRMSKHPIRRKYKEYLTSLSGGEITWDQVVAYWTNEEDGSDSSPWEILEPLRLPQNGEEKDTVEKFRCLLTELLNAQGTPKACCQSRNHKTCVSSHDAMYIIYLASISQERRSEIVRNVACSSTSSQLTRDQLLNEAELIATAIETSDQTTF